MRGFALIVLFLFATACGHDNGLSPLQQLMMSSHPAITQVAHEPSYYEVQIIYTEIEEDQTGKATFTDHTFQLDSKRYFYPASTVKLPAAVLALEWADGIPHIDKYTPYTTQRDSLPHSIADDVRQIFAVSDNEAYNRLYELMGRLYFDIKLTNKGIKPVMFRHRLSTKRASDSVRSPIEFNGQEIKKVGYSDHFFYALELKNQLKGKGFLRNDSLISEPMDFSLKNYFPLQAQHDLMKRIFFPENFGRKEQFQLSEKSLLFLKEQMSILPRNNGYDENEYYDSYGKFFMYGDSKERIPGHIKIYNKVGYAYGTLTDTAYIVDEKEGVQFLVSATILVNKNGIFNDDSYEYDEIGIPFLAQVGRELYLYERLKK